jgi:parallel beta-helix repeat protein
MSRSLALIVLGALSVPHAAGAAATCADRTPASITVAAPASRKCQDTIAKAGAKFLGSKLKTLSKCKLKSPAGSCPTADDTAKIKKAADSAAATISKDCGTDSAQAGLSSSYASLTDETAISSCMLSQHSVVADFVSAETHGPTTEPFQNSGAARADCVKEIDKSGTKFFLGALKAAGKCLSAQSKAGASGNLSPVCLGSFSGGAFVAPTDPKTKDAQAKLIQKTDDAIAKKCGPAETAGAIASIFACPGSSTVADLQKCLECTGLNGTFDAAEQEYAERGTFVAHGPANAIQTAVSAAAPGGKVLIGSGTYQEEVNVTTPNLSIVGCGAATSDRPKIIEPPTVVTGQGFQAVGVDGLTFQSLDFFDQASDHIFVQQSNDVTFRDITGDGNRRTRYAVFPRNCNNVLVELCSVRNQADAPLYVGQSSTIVVRFNDVRQGVSGIEIENSGNAQVYGNYGAGNTAGLLVFKDGSLPVQLAQCHSVHHNLFENNNEPNFGQGTVAGVPTGTGILVISADYTPYSYNLLRGNNTAGLVLTDQVIASFGPPFSADESVDGNYVFNNVMSNNGVSPDPARWQVAGSPLPGVDVAFLTAQSSGNCENGNTFDPMKQLGWNSFHTGTNTGTCVLPPPAVFPTCPAPPISSTTTTTPTTTTTSTTSPSSPSPAFVDAPSAR